MSSRDYTKHLVSSTPPTNTKVGDEYYDPVTNKLYKKLAVNGTTVTNVELLTTQLGSAFSGARGQVFTASGTFTIPAGISSIKVTLLGGGGGGGGYRSACSSTAGSGGGSGAFSVQYFTGLTPGNTLNVTVGALGTLATNGNSPTNGGAGGTSSIESGTQSITTASANGGGAGISAGGAGNAATAGAGGAASSSGVAYSIAGINGFLPDNFLCSNRGGLGASALPWGVTGRTVGVAATGFGASGSGGGFVDANGATGVATISTVGRPGIVIVEW